MRGFDAPDIDYRLLYRKAIAQTQRNADRTVLQTMENRMVAAADAYDLAMQGEGPHAIAQIALTDAEDALVRELYDKRIVAKNGACRSTYDDIYNSAASCPFCLDGEIYEVDHFLPQAHHHDIVMYPANLVPICHPCNHIKLELRPVDATRSLLHPYFDRLPVIPWLFAELDRKANGPVLNYRVALNQAVYGNIAPRLVYHFEILELDRRMRVRSANVLVELQADVEDYLQGLGAEGLKAHFEAEAAKRYDRFGNTLEAAAYHAASLNDAFCAGDYRN